MDSEKFEREILKLAFETDIRITVATVAYYFGIPSRDARVKLDELIDAGLLELDSDRDGNLFYKLHQEAGSAVAGRIETLTAPTAKSPIEVIEEEPRARRPSISKTLSYEPPASATEPPQPSAPATPRNHQERETSPRASAYSKRGAQTTCEDPSYTNHAVRSYAAQCAPPPYDDRNMEGTNAPPKYKEPRYSQPYTSYPQVGIPPRENSYYSNPYTSGSSHPSRYVSPLIIADNAACDSRTTSYDYSQNYYPARSNNYSPSEEYYYEQQREALLPIPHDQKPEEIDYNRKHHPAIAVLLSLCLPGAGQFYNGQIEKGVFMMLMTFLSWMALFGWAFQLWSIFDALIVASRIRSAQDVHRAQLEQQESQPRRAITSSRRYPTPTRRR